MLLDNWIISLSIAIVALAFVALVVFLGITLLSLRKTLSDVDEKIHSLDPLFRVVSKTGDAIEKKANRVRFLAQEVEEQLEEEVEERNTSKLNTAVEIAQWTLVGVALWQKLRDRRK